MRGGGKTWLQASRDAEGGVLGSRRGQRVQRARDALPWVVHLERWAEASKAKVRRLDFLPLVSGSV